jgi:tRNA(Ile)-lysidine synthase
MALDPAVAAVRLAVRNDLFPAPGATVLVACSGGADSLSLLAATVFEGHKHGLHVVGVTVDHGLQEASAAQAQHVVAQMAALGADETVAVRVQVTLTGQGPEAAAREARYAVLEEVAQRFGSQTVLLGHTLDDQAETVLLGLARGSGGRSLAGMRRGFDVFRRPLLDISRAQTEAACRAEGIEWWTDPHNEDPRFTRSRVRHRVLPLLEEELGPGVAAALARTADQLRADTEALDDLAEASLRGAAVEGDADDYRALDLEALPWGLTTRVLRRAAVGAGAIESELTYRHVLAVADLVLGPEGSVRHKQIQLPGHVTAYRDGDLLRFRPTAVTG